MKRNGKFKTAGSGFGYFLMFLVVLAGIGYYLIKVNPSILRSLLDEQPQQAEVVVEEDETPAAPPDLGPGTAPVRSGTDGSVPVMTLEIRRQHNRATDIIFQEWTYPRVVDYNGKKHWGVDVVARVYDGSNTAMARRRYSYTGYFRDNKLVAVEPY